MNRNVKRSLQLVVYFPAHDRHKRRVAERLAVAFELQFYFASVVGLVACFAERNEIVWAVAAGLPGLKMMNVQDSVLALAVAVLTLVIVAEQDIFSYVPEAELWSVLVVGSGEARVPEPLRIELPDFNGN